MNMYELDPIESRVEVRKNVAGEWFWHIVDEGNNETLATSEAYSSSTEAADTAVRFGFTNKMDVWQLRGVHHNSDLDMLLYAHQVNALIEDLNP
jgi:uncharacterized protein YegP (UPF0339 family)